MNRIVLIGNGFDLAHGLKTSYADFINWYWDVVKEKILGSLSNIYDDGLCFVKSNKSWPQGFWAVFTYDINIGNNRELPGKDFVDFLGESCNMQVVFSPLLEAIMHNITEQKWVDIERIYYTLLCKSLKGDSKLSPVQLNNQLSALTNKLQEYLQTVEESVDKSEMLKDSISRKIFSPIQFKDIAVCASQQKRDYINELKESNPVRLRIKLADYERWRKFLQYNIADSINKIKEDGKILDYNFDMVSDLFLPEQIMFVNFNYTKIADLYIPASQSNNTFSVNHIHGTLENSESMIFGYGDEMDKHYEELADFNDNEYLNNVKSIRYLEASNYHRLLEFVESAPYQIYIMGHSCGNSDRTLLNTLFEHENCISIKPFYFVRPDGTDNYRELVQNISRNFKDKQALRAKVVPKDCCEPLPQASAN